MADQNDPLMKPVILDAAGDDPEVHIKFGTDYVITYTLLIADSPLLYGDEIGHDDNKEFNAADQFQLPVTAAEAKGKFLNVHSAFVAPGSGSGQLLNYYCEVHVLQGGSHAAGSPVVWQGNLNRATPDSRTFTVQLA